MADYKINEFGEITLDKVKYQQDPLWEEYARLEYEVLNNHHNPTKDSIKIARYNELKKHFDIQKSVDALNKAKEKIKNEIINSDEKKDNSVLYTALANFRKTNE